MSARLRQAHLGSPPAAYAGRKLGKAFTLVEMLIVVATIGVLLTLLAPTLLGARDCARMVACQNQLRGWGCSFAMYAAQNDNFYPHTDGLDRDNGPADYYGWVDVLPPISGQRPWRDHPPWQRPGAGTMFQCPSARLVDDALYSYNARRNGFFSYAMNSCLELDENCWRAPGDTSEPMPSFLRADRIVQPPRVILLLEQVLDPRKGYDGRRSFRDAGKYCGSYPKAFGDRHARGPGRLGGSILYCDGHVEWTESMWKPGWPADLEVPPRSDPDWFPYPP